MILRIEDLRGPCATILSAVDSSELSQITETLELVGEGTTLYMSVTNKEYYVRVAIDVAEELTFRATVNATLFLRLISQITTDTVEFSIVNNALVIVGNGKYKLPLIYEGEELLHLPEIALDNVTAEFDIPYDILSSIMVSNGKQLSLGTITRPVQKFFYVDEKGALTFTSGACVNKFTLAQPVKMLLNQRLVKLFKLFKGANVHFRMSQDKLSEGIEQTRVGFQAGNVLVTAALFCDSSMMDSVPVAAIRSRAENEYEFGVQLNQSDLIETLSRLSLFTGKDLSAYMYVDFCGDHVEFADSKRENKECLNYKILAPELDAGYSAILDLVEIKAVIEACDTEFVSLKFGDHQAILVCNDNITNVVPEIHSVA